MLNRESRAGRLVYPFDGGSVAHNAINRPGFDKGFPDPRNEDSRHGLAKMLLVPRLLGNHIDVGVR